MTGNKAHAICGAQTRSGKPCRQKPMKNGRCRMHGGKSTGAKTAEGKKKVSQNAVKHGAYIDRIISEQEREIYDWLHESTIEKYELERENPAHMAILHRACITYLKLIRLDEWEMLEEYEPISDEMEKDPKSGKELPVPQNVYNADGEIIGEERVRKRRLRWSKNAPAWETHFQKYIQMLGVDRATEQKQKADQGNADKVVDAFEWLFGRK